MNFETVSACIHLEIMLFIYGDCTSIFLINQLKFFLHYLMYPFVSVCFLFVDIAFQSSLTKHLQNMNNEETVIFDKVSLNEGNAYNQKTGEFTAAVEGVYSFSWKMFTSRGKYFITHIVHNGNPIAYNHCDGRGISVGHVSSSNQANIKMKRGDKVWIKTRKGDGLFAHGGNWCDFSGYKI